MPEVANQGEKNLKKGRAPPEMYRIYCRHYNPSGSEHRVAMPGPVPVRLRARMPRSPGRLQAAQMPPAFDDGDSSVAPRHLVASARRNGPQRVVPSPQATTAQRMCRLAVPSSPIAIVASRLKPSHMIVESRIGR